MTYNSALVAPLVEAAARHNIEVTVEPGRILYPYEAFQYTCWGVWLGQPTDEILTDLTEWFSNTEEPMNIYSTDLFQFLAGDMIGTSTITLTISSVTLENMNSGKGGAQTKPCLHFAERNKLMVLNKTNAKLIAGELGPETENWKGARVTIAAPIIDAFGKSARSLRVVKVEPPPAMVAPKPRGTVAQQPPAAAQQDWLGSDDEAAVAAALETVQGLND